MFFYVLLLKQDNNKKEQVDKVTSQLEFKSNNNGKEYEIKAIWDSVVYAKKSEIGYLPGFYYQILWKSYPKEKNT